MKNLIKSVLGGAALLGLSMAGTAQAEPDYMFAATGFVSGGGSWLSFDGCQGGGCDNDIATIVGGGDFVIPLGQAEVKREGSDLSLISHGRSVHHCLEAAGILQAEHGISAEVLDLRSIRPLDQEAIIQSVMKTSRAVLVDESKPFCGVSSQIATLIQEHAFDHLDAPVKRVCTLDAPAIYSPHIEDEQLPNARRIIEQVKTIA